MQSFTADDFGENSAQTELEVAFIRILNILRKHKIANVRTLEVKISECGKRKAAPHWITAALRELATQGIVIARRDEGWPCEVYHLAATNPDEIDRELAGKVPLLKIFHHFSSRSTANGPGPIAERIVGDAFAQNNNFTIIQWGNVTNVGGINLPSTGRRPGSADGLILARGPTTTLDTLGLVEIKNGRGQIAPTSPIVWKIIREAYATDTVPILIARLLYKSTKSFVFSRVGGFGISTFSQFAPASMMHTLDPCKHKNGLGFKDLNFSEAAPTGLVKMLTILAREMPNCMRRLLLVRNIVTPYLETLADANIPVDFREESFRQLQADLDEYDGIESSYQRLWQQKRQMRPYSNLDH